MIVKLDESDEIKQISSIPDNMIAAIQNVQLH